MPSRARKSWAPSHQEDVKLLPPVAVADACSNRESRNGATVSGTGVLANVIGGVLALLLIIYLFVALVKPEKF